MTIDYICNILQVPNSEWSIFWFRISVEQICSHEDAASEMTRENLRLLQQLEARKGWCGSHGNFDDHLMAHNWYSSPSANFHFLVVFSPETNLEKNMAVIPLNASNTTVLNIRV